MASSRWKSRDACAESPASKWARLDPPAWSQTALPVRRLFLSCPSAGKSPRGCNAPPDRQAQSSAKLRIARALPRSDDFDSKKFQARAGGQSPSDIARPPFENRRSRLHHSPRAALPNRSSKEPARCQRLAPRPFLGKDGLGRISPTEYRSKPG